MNIIKVFTVLALSLVVAGTASIPIWADDGKPQEIIIKLKPGKASQLGMLAGQTGASVKKSIPKLDAHTLRLPRGASLEEALKRYRNHPAVEYAGKNHTLRIASQVFPNDPLFFEGVDLFDLGIYFTQPQWGLYNDGYNNGWGGLFRADIKAPEAWAINTGSPDVIIAILDTGIDYTHPDLAGKIWMNPGETENGQDSDGNGYVDDVMGWNFAYGNNDPMDNHSQDGLDIRHGTFTAGIAGAETDNYWGMAGVSWGSPLMALKVMKDDGTGLEDDAAEAVIYAVDNGAKIINMSLTGEDAPLLKDAVAYAWANGALVVAASGNAGISTPTFPASYPNVLAVGATNEYDQRCTAADWGSGGSNYGDYLDVMAPGNNILSATNVLDYQGYFVLPGTSAAAPFVAGVAALVWSQFPDWTNEQVARQIISTADDIGAPGYDIFTGHGRVNAYRALTELPSSATSIAQLKTLPAGQTVSLSGGVLTTGSGDLAGRLYIQAPDRSSGILLSFAGNPPAGLAAGDVVDVFGTTGKVSGEVALMNPIVTKTGTTASPKPLWLNNLAMGGGAHAQQAAVVNQYSFPRVMADGLNNIGLLVKVSGKVRAIGFDWFYLDDGSNLDDGTGNIGVLVQCGTLVRPGLNRHVTVTGISSCDQPQGSPVIRRVLRPRVQTDIRLDR